MVVIGPKHQRPPSRPQIQRFPLRTVLPRHREEELFKLQVPNKRKSNDSVPQEKSLSRESVEKWEGILSAKQKRVRIVEPEISDGESRLRLRNKTELQAKENQHETKSGEYLVRQTSRDILVMNKGTLKDTYKLKTEKSSSGATTIAERSKTLTMQPKRESLPRFKASILKGSEIPLHQEGHLYKGRRQEYTFLKGNALSQSYGRSKTLPVSRESSIQNYSPNDSRAEERRPSRTPSSQEKEREVTTHSQSSTSKNDSAVGGNRSVHTDKALLKCDGRLRSARKNIEESKNPVRSTPRNRKILVNFKQEEDGELSTDTEEEEESMRKKNQATGGQRSVHTDKELPTKDRRLNSAFKRLDVEKKVVRNISGDRNKLQKFHPDKEEDTREGKRNKDQTVGNCRSVLTGKELPILDRRLNSALKRSSSRDRKNPQPFWLVNERQSIKHVEVEEALRTKSGQTVPSNRSLQTNQQLPQRDRRFNSAPKKIQNEKKEEVNTSRERQRIVKFHSVLDFRNPSSEILEKQKDQLKTKQDRLAPAYKPKDVNKHSTRKSEVLHKTISTKQIQRPICRFEERESSKVIKGKTSERKIGHAYILDAGQGAESLKQQVSRKSKCMPLKEDKKESSEHQFIIKGPLAKKLNDVPTFLKYNKKKLLFKYSSNMDYYHSKSDDVMVKMTTEEEFDGFRKLEEVRAYGDSNTIGLKPSLCSNTETATDLLEEYEVASETKDKLLEEVHLLRKYKKKLEHEKAFLTEVLNSKRLTFQKCVAITKALRERLSRILEPVT